MSLSRKLRTAVRIGPKAAARIVSGRLRERAERAAVARGASWPRVDTDPGAARWLIDPLEVARACAGTREAEETVAAADAYLRHEFELLGSRREVLGESIDWSRDFKSGTSWPACYMRDLVVEGGAQGADVKVPWELSRHQHFVTLGQAYRLTGDDAYAREFVAQLTHWMDANPPMQGVNWACTMDVALRAVSWAWAWCLFEDSAAFDDDARRRFLSGIVAHGRFILGHLEWDEVRGNHYLANGTGLAVLGIAFPGLPGAAEWRRKGFEIVWGELPRQVLPDGVDFEMSTSYQRLVFELIATPTILAERNGYEVPAHVRPALERMLEFTMAVTRPDGRVAQFGDNDNGRVQILSQRTRTDVNDHRYLLTVGAALFGRPDFKAVSGEWCAEAEWLLGEDGKRAYEALDALEPSGAVAFPHGGFYLMRRGDMWLLADCGPVGYAGRGGHGHNDALSFELCVGDTPVVIDPGTFVYTPDPAARDEMRSSAAHNVLRVDGREMADLGPDMWTIADQARAEVVEWRAANDAQRLEGVHHGYERLTEPVLVRRRFELTDAGLRIMDAAEGVGRHDLDLRFHTACDVLDMPDGFVLKAQGEPIARVTLEAGEAEPFREPAWISPSYGVRFEGVCFGWRVREAETPRSFVTRIEALR